MAFCMDIGFASRAVQVLAQKLEGLGAKVATRLGKEVTHIVFQRQRNAEKQEQEAEDVELRGLFDKAAKVWLLELALGLLPTSPSSDYVSSSSMANE